MSYDFRILWRIEGVPELGRVLLNTHEKVKDFKIPLWNSAKLILSDVERNFITEGSLVGGWQRLAKATVEGRLRLGYGGEHPILQRTGKLRRSFYSRVTATKAIVTSRSPYFVYHQSRLPRTTKLPRRAMLVLIEYTRQNIMREFNKFLKFR